MRKLGLCSALCSLLVPAAVFADAGAGGVKVRYDNGTVVEIPSAGFSVKTMVGLQPRYEFTDNDSGGNTSSFDIHRARFIANMSAMDGEFTGKFQANFAGEDDTELKDAWVMWNACDWGGVGMGQHKTGISRQYNTSGQNLQFIDRSSTSDQFTLGRAEGAQLAAEVGGADLTLAIYNGESDGEGENLPGVDTKHTGVVTLRGDLMGEMNPMVEGDLDRTEGVAVNVGTAYSYSQANQDVGGFEENVDIQRLSVDGNVKSDGMSLAAEFFWASTEGDTAASESDPTGFYAQAGAMLTDEDELAIRFGYTDCDENGGLGGDCIGADNFSEAAVSFNHYFWGNNLKGQVGYSALSQDPTGGGSDVNTNIWSVQLSAYL